MQPEEMRTILITGCSSGIGYACAHGLRERGYRVFASARKPEDVERLSSEGLEALRLDLDDPATIRDAVDRVLSRTQGQLYALFNNGAYTQVGAVEDLSRAVLRAQLETNLLGWHELTCRLIPIMRHQGYGRIVQNSSILGLTTLAYRGAYVASKFALEGLTDTLRLELAGSGIQVSLIEPGPIKSRIRANSYEKFRAHIDREHSPHREQYRAVEKRLLRERAVQPFTLPPQAVLKKLIHALESPRPKPRYYVTVPTYLFGGLRRVLSSRGLDRVLRWISDSGSR
ncbi:SDR family oxidoreductase [Candidatus Thiosymbion oneisti]|uniref:SDR family oxidoreductase n=1 Tax=Candidatus Thiosymbion oneisti TaxID=589554 RepID=UPI000A53F30D|nr:SDR family oxidoreductase [Candidatus Thiosymbion oneisti]